jgi:hypothetical protein
LLSIPSDVVNDNEIIEQTSKMNYLGIKLTSDGNTEREVSEQLMKANRIIGCLDQWYSTGGRRTPGGTRRHLRGYVKFKISIYILFPE